jgi:hypothetical protein
MEKEDELELEISLFFMFEKNPERVGPLFDDIVQNDGWALSAIEKRFLAYSLMVDKSVMIYIFVKADGVVGKCAKYVDFLVNQLRTAGLNELTWGYFRDNFYPLELP